MTIPLRSDKIEARVCRAMLAALKEIAKRDGPFKIDPYAHAFSCIENMGSIADRAIADAEAAGIKAEG